MKYFLFLITILLSPSHTQASETDMNTKKLYPYLIDDYYVYVDEANNIVLPTRYSDARPFDGDVAVVTVKGKKGVIDTKGNWVLKPKFDRVDIVRKGAAQLLVTSKAYRKTEKGIFAVNGLRYSKNGKLLSKNGEKHLNLDSQFCSVKFKNIIIMNTKIEVKEMPEMQVIYCRHTGEFNQIHEAYEKLMKWAVPRGLLNFPETKTLTLYRDDPAVTDIKKSETRRIYNGD